MAIPGYVIKHKRTTLERAEKFISTQYFTDCNLQSRLIPKRVAVSKIEHYAAPGRISYDEAVQGSFAETTIGQPFGPAFSTHWFRLEIKVPDSWIDDEVYLVWDSLTEAMVWRNGEPVQGLSPENRRTNFLISKKLTDSERSQVLYIEMAVQGLLGAGVTADGGGDIIAPPHEDAATILRTADLVVIDRDIQNLILDFEILIGLNKHLPTDCNQSFRALYLANEMVNTIELDNRETYKKAHQLAVHFFSQKNGATQHTVKAVGNCHIDTAWMWPYDETKRKCARSFSSTIRLLEEYPQYKFVASQAQQFEWVKENYPSLFEQIKHYVSIGRFIPVGGTWVEMDGNIPSGEAFVRQFLLGQKFFKKEFGMQCTEFWLPDTFGYSAQLPQIVRGSAISRFVTQKLSWSLVNKFPHHTFWWKGIDGSSVLTHFPPGNTYCMKGTVEEVMKSINNYEDKGRSNSSLYLYGYGDGGQGPTAEIIERLIRMEDVDGLPRVRFSTPDEYFTEVEQHEASKLCHWNGELYLELHNGTYTTQALTKKWNRQSEFALHDAEMVSVFATLLSQTVSSTKRPQYPANELTRLWKLVLLNQFHDVLPGTSIADVYKDVFRFYEDVASSTTGIINESISAILEAQGCSKGVSDVILFNTMGWSRSEVVTFNAEQAAAGLSISEELKQLDADGNVLALVKAAPFGFTHLRTVDKPAAAVTINEEQNGDIRIKNGLLEAIIDLSGRLVELYVSGCKNNSIARGSHGNQLVIFDDVPLYWDAWDVMDYHLQTRKTVDDVQQSAKIVERGPLRAAIEVSHKISSVSSIKQLIVLEADSPCLKFINEVEWHESHKFLKVEFPINVVSANATYEIQYGYLQRPTHFNTSWDWAKFEVCGHKWADLSEYDWGVSVLNDSKYGWSCIDNTLRLSLLRSPKSPDKSSDMGHHTFTYAVMPHKGTFQSAGVIQAAYNLNSKLRLTAVSKSSDTRDFSSFLLIDTPAVILSALKKAEEIENTFVLRLYEAYGSHVTANIKINLPFKYVKICDLLEMFGEDANNLPVTDGTFSLEFKPFQIVSVVIGV